jgi:hypothetical protein
MMVEIIQIGNVTRFPAGTDYNLIVAAARALLLRCPRTTEIAVDATGVGNAVVDMFTFQGVMPWAVTATSGLEQSVDIRKRRAHVPKLQLVSRLQSLLYEQRLKISDQLPEARTVIEELRNFRVEYTAAGNLTYNARSGQHDDVIAALGVAIWRLTDGQLGWGPPSPYLAALGAGLAAKYTGSRAAPWCLGLDLGKLNDRSVLICARRISINRVDLEGDLQRMTNTPELPMQPESEVDAEGYIGSTEWFTDQDEQQKRAVEGRTPTGPLATGIFSAPRKFAFRPQPGSLEWQRIEDENFRYRALLNGRRPTAEEREEHENNLKTIREAHHAD